MRSVTSMRPSSAKARSQGWSRPPWIVSAWTGSNGRINSVAAIDATAMAATTATVAARPDVPRRLASVLMDAGSRLTEAREPSELLGGLDVRCARTARVGLDVERYVLAADETIEVDRLTEPVAVEEIILAILAGDE